MYSSDEEDLDPENLRPIMDASDGSPVARLCINFLKFKCILRMVAYHHKKVRFKLKKFL